MSKFKHLCPDWDYMEICYDDPEFQCCTCYGLGTELGSTVENDKPNPPEKTIFCGEDGSICIVYGRIEP